MKTFNEIQTILHAHMGELRKRYKVRSLSIFGSYARNEQTDRSDVDLLVEYGEAVSLFDVVDMEFYLSDLLGVKVDLILKRSIHSEIRDAVLREAVPV
jgi:predicted nucleotidyltransferase